jgi:hypothetical protein
MHGILVHFLHQAARGKGCSCLLVLICFRSLGRAFTSQAHQVPVSLAPRIAAVYSASGALAVLKSNPYKLVVDVKYAGLLCCKCFALVTCICLRSCPLCTCGRGVGFARVDAIARKMGVDPFSPHRFEVRRVFCGLLLNRISYALREVVFGIRIVGY